jgi:hypothetical protein
VDKCCEALVRKHQETFASPYNEPNPALFGDGPENTYWQMSHGAGGGCEQVDDWMTSSRVSDVNELWERAAHD